VVYPRIELGLPDDIHIKVRCADLYTNRPLHTHIGTPLYTYMYGFKGKVRVPAELILFGGSIGVGI
jgi:hypothetical protein